MGCSSKRVSILSRAVSLPDRSDTFSSELEVKVVNIDDMTRVQYLREQQKPVKHLSYDPSGRMLTVSCTDGVIYVYSMDGSEPELMKKVDGITRRLESEDQASAAVVWHPDGRAFASATATKG
jgi:chromosome transmission fidelity protein 4